MLLGLSVWCHQTRLRVRPESCLPVSMNTPSCCVDVPCHSCSPQLPFPLSSAFQAPFTVATVPNPSFFLSHIVESYLLDICIDLPDAYRRARHLHKGYRPAEFLPPQPSPGRYLWPRRAGQRELNCCCLTRCKLSQCRRKSRQSDRRA